MPQQSLKRRVKERAKRSLRTFFELGQRFGVDILPRHFYSSIPDIRYMRNHSHWRAPSSMSGVRGVDPDEQLAFLRETCAAHADRLSGPPLHEQAIARAGEVGFGEVEAELLYCFVATRRPARVVQVGCGVSTAVILEAMQEANHECRVTCVEPFASEFLRKMHGDGRIELVAEKAQEVPLDVFTDLGPGDLLFIDSTHVVAPGSEVVRLVLEVMPRLAPGVNVHFHDIFFPYTYQREILAGDLFFSAETILLQAFLAQNAHYRITTSLSMLHYARQKELREIFPHYTPAPHRDGLVDGPGHFPSSTYLVRDGA